MTLGVKTTGEPTGEPIYLDQGSDLRVFGTLVVNHPVYAYSGIWTPEEEEREDHISGEDMIAWMKNFADFGRSVYDALGDRLSTDIDFAEYKEITEDEWPDGEEEQIFAFLVKYGDVEPWTDENDGNRKYWPAHESITYGDAKQILGNLWKALGGEESTMPDVSIEWIEGNQGAGYNEPMDDDRVNMMLAPFIAALPKQNDDRTEITLIRDNQNEGDENRGNDGMTITGKTFTKHVTITCDPQYLGDDTFGGDIKFNNCEFEHGVTVEMTGGVGYNVRLNNNCTGSFTVDAENGVIGQENTNVNFFGMNGVTINGLTISGDVVDAPDEDFDDVFNVNVRYDEDGEDSYISTLEIRNSTKNSVIVTGTYTGKLRVAGKLNISGVKLGDNSRIELSNQCDSTIALGSNNILVNDDCGGEYSFTGTGTVTVPNQNQNANITVYDRFLGTPHIFGRDSFGIFLPLNSMDGVTLTVEQGQWNEEQQCVDSWTTLEYTDENKGDGGINLQAAEGKTWIDNPYQVKLTVTIDGCTVVYDTMMWKPVQLGEFLEELEQRLGEKYTMNDLGLDGDEGTPLTFGACKTAFAAILEEKERTDVSVEQIITDENYWTELKQWEDSTDEHKADWNPDNWTRHWNDLDDMLDKLIAELKTENEPEQ